MTTAPTPATITTSCRRHWLRPSNRSHCSASRHRAPGQALRSLSLRTGAGPAALGGYDHRRPALRVQPQRPAGQAMDADTAAGPYCSTKHTTSRARARDMYSARLAKAAADENQARCSGALAKAVNRINRQFWRCKSALAGSRTSTAASTCRSPVMALQHFTGAVSAQLAQEPAFLQRHPI